MDRILIIIPNFGKGGAERVLSRVLFSLSDLELKNVTFLTLNHDLGYDLPSGVEVIKLKEKRLKKAIPSLIKIINDQRWKVIYSTLNHFNLILPLLVFKRKNIKLICRESILPITYYKSFGFFGKLLLIYYKFIMRSYNTIIVQSLDMMKEVRQLNIKKTYLINNPSPNYEVNFDKSKVNDFIYIARWHDQKNYEELIKFWKWIKDKKKNNINLLCIGVGNKAQELNENLAGYNIHFIDRHSNIKKVLNESSYYINFSKYEGFSNSILEALSCGLPVFALDFLGGKQELLNEENSVVSKVKSLTISEKDFDLVYNDLAFFLNKKWDNRNIKSITDEKFDMKTIIKEFKKIFFK